MARERRILRTYIPKESGRKLIKKKNKEDLETVIIDYIESDKKDTFKERFFIWVERQKYVVGLIIQLQNTNLIIEDF